MSLLQRFQTAFKALAGAPLFPWPSDDYQGYGLSSLQSNAGQRVSPDTAMRLSAVFACVRRISETVASLPLVVYQQRADGGKERATKHPLYFVLHKRPNAWQTSSEFRMMMQGHLELRGNAYAEIVPGPRGAIDQLIPLHPDRVRCYFVADEASGKYEMYYQVQNFHGGKMRWLMQDEMFHLRGISSNGLVGISPIAQSAETIGGAQGREESANRYTANDSKPSGIIEFPGKLSPEAAERLRKSWQDSQSGADRHKVAVLEDGLKYQPLSISPKDAQFLEMMELDRSKIASIFGVPLHKIGDLSKATFSNIEHQSIEFLTDCIRPRLVAWEERLGVDLIDPLYGEDAGYFAQFTISALLRGDQKARTASYAIARQWGWMNVNEIREEEGLNPIGEQGDEYLRPLNMSPAGKPGEVQEIVPGKGGSEDDAADDAQEETDGTGNSNARALEIATGAAQRVIRRECNEVRRLIAKNASVWEISAFYTGHADFVSEALALDPARALSYAEGRAAAFADAPVEQFRLLVDGIAESGALELAELAMEGK